MTFFLGLRRDFTRDYIFDHAWVGDHKRNVTSYSTQHTLGISQSRVSGVNQIKASKNASFYQTIFG